MDASAKKLLGKLVLEREHAPLGAAVITQKQMLQPVLSASANVTKVQKRILKHYNDTGTPLSDFDLQALLRQPAPLLGSPTNTPEPPGSSASDFSVSGRRANHLPDLY